MIEVNKIFEKAVGRLDNECDIIDVMEQVRKSKNFMRNHLRREQKILLKFDSSNVIDANSESEEGSAEEEEVLDQAEIISKNLNSTNGLVAMWQIGNLLKIFKPLEGKKLEYFDANLFKSFFLVDDDLESETRVELGLTKRRNRKKKADPLVVGTPEPKFVKEVETSLGAKSEVKEGKETLNRLVANKKPETLATSRHLLPESPKSPSKSKDPKAKNNQVLNSNEW